MAQPMDIDIVTVPPKSPQVVRNAAPQISPRASRTVSKKQGSSMSCPDEFLCPITSGLMRDPVLLVQTGHSYERTAIERWFQGNATCPLTGVNLTTKQVSPNVTLRKLIQDWAARNPTHSAVVQQISAPVQPAENPVPPGGDPSLVAPLGAYSPRQRPFPPRTGVQHFGRFDVFPNEDDQDLPTDPVWAQLMPPPGFSRRQQAPLSFTWDPAYHVGDASMPAADDDEPLEPNAQASPSGGQNAAAATSDTAASAVAAAPPTLTLTPEFETVGLPQQETLVLVRTGAPASGQRVPIDLVAILDVSGSMQGSRLELVKETMLFVITHLQPSDRLSIVTFSDSARRRIKLTRATDGGKEQMRAAVNCLCIEGGTSILPGLKLGQHVLTSRRQSNPVACMFLLSDGQDTSGLQPSEARRQAGNIPVHTFGYGVDHDDRILDAISAGSNGTFSFVRDNNEVKEAVAQSLGGALSVALQETTVHLQTAARGVAILSVNAGVYEATVDQELMTASVALKDMYAGETRDFLVKLCVPVANNRLVPTKLLTGRLYYKLPGREEVNRSEVTVSAARGERPEGTQSNLDVDLQRNRLNAADAMRAADTLAEAGDLNRARDVIASALAAISQSASAGAPACVGVMEDLRRVGLGFASESEYRREGTKMAKSAGRTHASQRAAFSSDFARPQSGPRQPSISQYASPAAASMSRAAFGDTTE